MSRFERNPDFERLRAIASTSPDDVIVFAGAGLTVAQGFPTWQGLLDELLDHANRLDRLTSTQARDIRDLVRNREYQLAADAIDHHLGDRRIEYLARRFGSEPPDDLGLSDVLASLGVGGFLTTNYDRCIETALRRSGSHVRPITPRDTSRLHPARLGREQFVLKIHGDATEMDFVLSTKEYDDLEQNEALTDTLATLFLQHTILFVGYSITDWEIQRTLKRLRREFGLSATRHFALLEYDTNRTRHQRTEDDLGLSIIEYSHETGHRELNELIAALFPIRTADSPASLRQRVALAPVHTARQLERLNEGAVELLTAAESRWGTDLTADPRPAPTAEALIALAAHRTHRPGKQPTDDVDRLLSWVDDGIVLSPELGDTNVQTHALVLLAATAWLETGGEIRMTVGRLAERLRQLSSPIGWQRSSGEADVSTVASCFSFLALHHASQFPHETWQRFRDHLLSHGVIGFHLTADESAAAAAGSVLMVLGARSAAGEIDDDDRALRTLALDQLHRHDPPFDHENEQFTVRNDNGVSGWRGWTHMTPALILLGSSHLVADVPQASTVAGRALRALLLEDDRSRSRPNDRFGVVSACYRSWAISTLVAHLGHGQIDKVGLVVRDERGALLLVRKFGTRLFMLPGGSREPHESDEETVAREIREELGCEVNDVEHLLDIVGPAAFEPGMSVRIACYSGTLGSEPTPQGEIEELRWFDLNDELEDLTPILRTELVPQLDR